MAEENPADAVVSSQNSTDDAGSQQSREQKFFNLYDVHVAGKETLVLSATQYNAVVDAILRDQRKEQLSAKERNWTKRFTMQLENGQNVLYRKDGKVVVAHHRTVHGGRDVTYRELSSYSGISKVIISLYLSLYRRRRSLHSRRGQGKFVGGSIGLGVGRRSRPFGSDTASELSDGGRRSSERSRIAYSGWCRFPRRHSRNVPLHVHCRLPYRSLQVRPSRKGMRKSMPQEQHLREQDPGHKR